MVVTDDATGVESYSHLLLIALPKSTKEQIAQLGWDIDDLVSGWDASELPQLYKWRRVHSEQLEKKFTIALPVLGGEGVLLLRRDKDRRNCFFCDDVYQFPTRIRMDQSAENGHTLPIGTRIKILERRDIKRYLDDALDCNAIEFDLRSKQKWEPDTGSNVENRIWEAYLKLSKASCDARQIINLPVVNVVAQGRDKLKVEIDQHNLPSSLEEQDLDFRLQAAQDDLFQFSLYPQSGNSKKRQTLPQLGKLQESSGKKGRLTLSFQLDEDFRKSLANEITAGNFCESTEQPADETVQLQPGSPESAEIHKFYEPGADKQEPPVFSCKAAKGSDGCWTFAPRTVEPTSLYLHYDLIGDRFQIQTMRNGLQEIKGRRIWKALTGERVAKLPREKGEDINLFNKKLNKRQKEAVRKALRTEELLLIWGPPGTGKTEVIAEIARQEAQRGHKTLIASQANLAVDNAIARLYDSPSVWPLRIAKKSWQPEEDDKKKVPMRETVDSFFLDRLTKQLGDSQKAEGVDANISALRKSFLQALRKPRKPEEDNPHWKRSVEQMGKIYLSRLNVVGATLMECGKRTGHAEYQGRKPGRKPYKLSVITKIKEFDTVIIDEVSKAMPPELFLPIPLGKRVILVGDHRQLPPVIKDPSGEDRSLKYWAKAAEVDVKDLEKPTLFERLWEKHSREDTQDIRAMLTTQYRMHPDIQKLIDPFYKDSEGELECGLTEEQQADLSVADKGPFAGRHIAWVGKSEQGQEEREGTSFFNRAEVATVGRLLDMLPARKDLTVGVITFYGAQLRALRHAYESRFRQRFGGLIFGTVDRFQGRECDVIICSLVRNNEKGRIGFATKINRINVAFSRARMLLCIVGSEDTFCYGEGDQDAKKAYKHAYYACEKAGGSGVLENALKLSFDEKIDKLNRKLSGRS